MKRSELQNNLAMTVTLIMGSMLFLTLFMGYAVYRTSAQSWPPMGMPRVSLTLPLISTLFILASSFFCWRTKKSVEIKNFSAARMNLNLTLLLGCGFMMAQMFLWSHMRASGVFVSSGIFASVMYGFTWIHAAHMILGLASLVYLSVVLKPTDARILQKSINVEKFWHFLGVIWIIMFLTIFVL